MPDEYHPETSSRGTHTQSLKPESSGVRRDSLTGDLQMLNRTPFFVRSTFGGRPVRSLLSLVMLTVAQCPAGGLPTNLAGERNAAAATNSAPSARLQ
ncbi:MAG: hypothetical protein ACK56I_07045, partial [bacterium]